MPQFLIGIDIGGTTTRVAIGSEDSGLIQIERFPTQDYREPVSLVERCRESAAQLLASEKRTFRSIKKIGIVVPGSIDGASGTVRVASNLSWKNVPLKTMAEDTFGIETVVENDANAAALGEWCVAGEPDGGFLYLTVSTGIGAGIIQDGHLWRGADGLAGELGHTVIERHGPICYCGSRGCLETLASGQAMEHMAREAVRDGFIPPSVETASDLVAAAAAGNPAAQDILDEVSDTLFTALKNLIYLLNPSMVCLGGGVIQGTQIFERVQSRVEKDSLLKSRTPLLFKAVLGDDAGLVGAIHMGAEKS